MLSLQRRTTRARKEAGGGLGRRRAYSDFAYDYNSSDSEASAPDDDAEASLDDEEDSDEEDESYRAPANKARRSAAAARGTYMNGTGSDTSGTDFYLQQGQADGNSGRAHKVKSSARVRKGRRDAKPSRVAANRRSAQRSRARKLQHVGELEKAVEQLHQELKASLPELSELREKQQAALQRNKKLKTQLRMAGVHVPDSPPPPTTDIKQEPDQEQRWQQQQQLKHEQQEEALASGSPSPFQGDLLSTMHAAMYGAPKAKAAAAAPAAPASTAAAGKPPLASHGSNRSSATTQASARGMRSTSSKSLHGAHVISHASGTSNGNKSPTSDSAGTAAPIPVWRARAQRSSVRPRQAQQLVLARAVAAGNQQQAQPEGTQHAGTAFLQQRQCHQQQQQQDESAMASPAEDEDTHMAPAPSFSLPMVDTSRALSITMPRMTTLPLTRSPTLDAAMEAASNPPTPSAGIAAFRAPHNAFARADTLEAALQAAFNLPPSGAGADAAMPLSRSATLEEAFIDAAAPSALGTGAAGPLAPGGLSEQTALAQVQQDIDAGLLDLGLASDPMVSEQLGSEVTAAAAAAADAVRSSGGDPVAAQLGALELAAPLLQEASGSVGSDHSSGLQWATSPQTLAGAPAMYGSSGYDGSSFSGRSLASGSSFGSGRSFNSGRSFGNGSSFSNGSGFGNGSSFAAGRSFCNGSSSYIGGRSFGDGSSSYNGGSSFGSDASMRDVSMGGRGRMAPAGGLVTADSGPLLVDNVPMPGLDALDALLVS